MEEGVGVNEKVEGPIGGRKGEWRGEEVVGAFGVGRKWTRFGGWCRGRSKFSLRFWWVKGLDRDCSDGL